MTPLLLPRASCQVGTVSSCVSWQCRTPTGSGRLGLKMAEAGGPALTGVGVGKEEESSNTLIPTRMGTQRRTISSVRAMIT